MLDRSFRIWKPEVFQGHSSGKNYFEGWYIKMVNESGNEPWAFIPGISFGEDGENHAFLQVLNGKTAEAQYIDFPSNLFSWDDKYFSVQIDGNSFSTHGMELNIRRNGISINGKISFGHLTGWPVKLFSPGAMGWYAFVPFMECYHGVVSFDHSLNGQLEINGIPTDFTGGRGYIEKDWGRSFPDYYIWIQSNHFKIPGTSLMSSVARIPWLKSSFDGFLAGFLFRNKLYRFTTYNGARITRLRMADQHVEVHYSTGRFRLEVMAERNDHHAELKSPSSGKMTERIRESMTAKVQVKLISGKGPKEVVVFEGTGINTGFEMGGKTELMKEI